MSLKFVPAAPSYDGSYELYVVGRTIQDARLICDVPVSLAKYRTVTLIEDRQGSDDTGNTLVGKLYPIKSLVYNNTFKLDNGDHGNLDQHISIEYDVGTITYTATSFSSNYPNIYRATIATPQGAEKIKSIKIKAAVGLPDDTILFRDLTLQDFDEDLKGGNVFSNY